MDKRVIDFSDLKKEKDTNKFESYIYGLSYDMAQGKLSMPEFSKKIMKFMEENNISHEEFFEIQKNLMKSYGFDTSDIETQIKNMGMDVDAFKAGSTSYEGMRKNMSFQEKYKSRIKTKTFTTYYIKNETNDIDILINEENVIIKSRKKIDLTEIELNEFLCSYKKVIDDKKLNISLCENAGEYQY